MALDPKKLSTYMAAAAPRPGRPATKQQAGGKALPTVQPFLKPGQSPQALLDLLERGDEVTPDQLGRLLSPKVAYMELVSDAVGFVCGSCGYLEAESANCRNPAVLAPVSAARGCCNGYWSEELVTFPPAAQD